MADKVDSENYGDLSDPVARLRGELEEARQQQGAAAAVSVLALVVDDEPDVEALFRQHFRRDLRAQRFEMQFASSVADALARIANDNMLAECAEGTKIAEQALLMGATLVGVA